MTLRRSAKIFAINAALRFAFALSPRLYRRHVGVLRIEPRRILVSRPDHIGDAILAMPALRAMRIRYPKAHIVMMVASWAADLFQNNTDADEILVADPPWWVTKRNPGLPLRDRISAWSRFAAAIGAIRSANFDLLVELRGDVRHIVAFGCLGAVKHIVTYRRNGGHFLADAWLPTRDDRHEIAQGTDLVELLGAPAVSAVPTLHGPAQTASVDLVLSEIGIGTSQPVIVVHPGAKKVNQWPLSHYEALMPRLLAYPDVRVVVTGSAGEAALADALCRVAPARISSVAGRLSMLEFSALVERADVFLCGDTGPMHLLNACDTPALLLFGPTDPRRFAPLTGCSTVVQGDRCCINALHERCADQPEAPYSRCMQSISPELVAARLTDLVGRELERRIAVPR